MRVAGLFAVLVACGGTKAAPAQAPVDERPSPPAQPTCGEVGIILRGGVEDRDEGAGPAKEKAIAESCKVERWSIPVIACVAGTPYPVDCLKQLSAEQKQRYDERISAWSRQFAPDESVDVPQSAPATCSDAAQASDYLDPPIDDTTPEHDWEAAMRQRTLVALCDHDGWSAETKTCLRDASSVADASTCSLDPTVHARVLVIRDLATSIEARRKKPAKLSCQLVVEYHYGDAKWKGKLVDKKPAERKRLIAESRKEMLAACTSEAWNEATRACVVADGDDEACFGLRRWDYPYVAAAAIPECIDYVAAVTDLEHCAAVPQATRDAIHDGVKSITQAITGLSPDARAAFATACKAGADAVRQTKAGFGC